MTGEWFCAFVAEAPERKAPASALATNKQNKPRRLKINQHNMPSELNANNLTTIARIKDRLEITIATKDNILERLINGASSFIERSCARKFKKASYTELVNIEGSGERIFSKQAPIVGSLTSIKYKAGLPGTPNYTALMATEHEIENAEMGIIRLYSSPARGTNAIELKYDAGFLVDFTAPTDLTKHTLPPDITDLCERLVSRAYRRLGSEGKDQETGGGGDSVTWSKGLTDEDKQTLAQFARISF